ncbi:hypothetical protein LTR08_006739 [Meristemomyces frigidus]|nr:hypothetical protein LTR08_006739 [Meristemomyces frigidus]
MALGWHPVRILGILFICVVSITVLVTWENVSIPSFDALATIKDSIGSLAHRNSSLRKNAYQLDPPPEHPPYGAVIAAGRSNEDLTWMAFFRQNWTTFPYDVDNANNSNEALRIPKNKGREAMVYLSFIIDNYESLPWCAIFVHGHSEAWHQDDTIVRLLGNLNRAALSRAGYISLRCDWYPSCPAEIRPMDHDAVVWGPGYLRDEAEAAIAGNWRQLFPGERLPATIASPCCAQFAVTRQAILRRPISDYKRVRQWLINTLLEDEVSGRVFEKLWAYMFTGEAVHCPPPQKCSCKYFGHCMPKKWTPTPEGLPPLPDWP